MEVLQRTANRGSIATDTGYDIEYSNKFESDNSEAITRNYDASTGANCIANNSTTNAKKFTVSYWVKKTELLASGQNIPWIAIAGGNATVVKFQDEKFAAYDDSAGWSLATNALFRDTSAWYHLVCAVDTTQSTASDRVNLYVNGVLQTSFSTENYGTQNNDNQLWKVNTSHTIGNQAYFKGGYIAELHCIDGTQYAASDFGEYDDDSGIWIPKEADVTYGDQGYYLNWSDFGSANSNANNTGVGKDFSGNTNPFVNLDNWSSADIATDTPTNNGCTLNVLASLEGSNDITEGALVSTGKAGGGGNFNGTYGTIGIDPFNSTVDWYWEIETSIGTSGSDTDIGIGWIKESRITSGSTAYNNVYADGISRYSSQTANAAGDIWGVLLETGTTPVMKLYRNDGLIYTATHGSGGVSFDTLMFPYITVKGTSVDARLNFLNPASSFSIASGNTDPNGYGNFEFDTKGGYALCTKNLAEYG